MKIRQLVYKSMRKNIRHYFLYLFALIFSVTLYVSFLTLQFHPAVLAATNESGSATAGFQAATYLLYFIVLFFVLYANHLFMKRRSKEIGLYQLIGMTKGLIVRMIALENIVLFSGAVTMGIGLGFLISRFFTMILLRILEQHSVAQMSFSFEALQHTIIVFSMLLIIIVIQTMLIVRRMTLLALFQANAAAEERIKPLSRMHMLLGAIGIMAIALGYYMSTQLFTTQQLVGLLINMLWILLLTIGGTFLVFRFSVSFLLNAMRLRKKGHMRLVDVVAFTPIMHRMKGNAKSLTLIAVLTAVSLAISTLSYISYYSIDAQVEQTMPSDIIVYDEAGAAYMEALREARISFDVQTMNVKHAYMDFQSIVKSNTLQLPFDEQTVVAIVKQSDAQTLYQSDALEVHDVYMMNYGSVLAELMPLQAKGEATLSFGDVEERVRIQEIYEQPIVAMPLSDANPALVVSDALYEKIPMLHEGDAGYVALHTQHFIHIEDEAQLMKATEIYNERNLQDLYYMISTAAGETRENHFSQRTFQQLRQDALLLYGVVIFTTAFLGLAFLLTTCSILYFKQMAEADEERASYTTLRKIGFSEEEIVRSIYVKQAFNFGVPLVVGLMHSYFAVKSGWFLFGSELVVPLAVMTVLYVLMYILFMLQSVRYYKQVVHNAL